MKRKKWVLRTVVMVVVLTVIAMPFITSYAADSAVTRRIPITSKVTFGVLIERLPIKEYPERNLASDSIGMHFEEQLQLLKSCYDEAYSEEKISRMLYITINGFLDNEKEIFENSEDSIKALEDLPEHYQNIIFEYCDVCREDLAHIIMLGVQSRSFNSSEGLKNAVKPFFETYNKDMEYLEQELEIYGIKEDLIIKESEFPALGAKG